MEGSLLKWTNYWNGWQPRWFVLKDGYLTYYNSQNDTKNGCKRSFKISMFDIIVNRSDSTRMDLIVANDQHLYLKACDYRERQKWLVALATQKANFPNSTSDQRHAYESSNLLKTKQSELRLYCDLLMQQVHEMKNVTQANKTRALSQSETASCDSGTVCVPEETQRMDELSSNISSTCEMLVDIIKNIIDINESNSTSPPLPPTTLSSISNKQNDNLNTTTGANHKPTYNNNNNNETNANNKNRNDTTTTTNNHNNNNLNTNTTNKNKTSSNNTINNNNNNNDNNNSNINNSDAERYTFDSGIIESTQKEQEESEEHEGKLDSQTNLKKTSSFSSFESNETFDSNISTMMMQHNQASNTHDQHQHTKQLQNSNSYQSFFNTIDHKFQSLKFYDHEHIPTVEFLDCCRDLFKILDYLGSTTFLPVKVDVTGNINKLAQKYSTNPNKYYSLQAIVQSEIDENVTKVKNSATDALLWLKRALWFLREIFYEFVTSTSPSADCIHTSYQRTLRQYHNWVIRGIFSLGFTSLPSKESFLTSLAIDQNEYRRDPTTFEKVILLHMKEIVAVVDRVLIALMNFYADHNLDPKHVLGGK